MKKKIPDLLALILAILVALGSVSNAIINFLKTPVGTQYLGTGSFFVPDYLNYLTAVAQGFRGNWQAMNLYTGEGTIGYWVVVWPYLLVGQLCRLFSIPPVVGYWIAVFFLTALMFFCSYLFLKLMLKAIGKNYLIFPTLLVFLFSGPLFLLRGDPLRLEIWRVTWYYQADFFERTSAILHHVVANLGTTWLFLASFYFFNLLKEKKYTNRSFVSWLVIAFVFLLIMSVAPTKLVYLLPAFLAALIYGIFFYRFSKLKDLVFYGLSFAVLILILFLFGLYFQKNISVTYYPEVLFWEKHMMQWPSIKNFFIVSGALMILVIPSLIILARDVFNKKLPPVILMGTCASVLAYGLFYTKISLLFNNHNSRFLFPDAYLFMAILVFLAAEKIKIFKKKKNILVLAIVLICFSLPSFGVALKQRINGAGGIIPPGREYSKYFPEEIIEGFSFLDKQESKNPLVLTTMFSDTGLILPVFTQARIYAAKNLGTINFLEKSREVDNFFTNFMTASQKTEFLKSNRIDYIVFTIFDVVNMDENIFKSPYFIERNLPIRVVFSNSKISIYEVTK